SGRFEDSGRAVLRIRAAGLEWRHTPQSIRGAAMSTLSAGDRCCPACRTALAAPDVETLGPTACPRCGAELWALVGAGAPIFFVRQPGQAKLDFLAAVWAPLEGKSPEQMRNLVRGLDSLDIVEAVMEIEDALRSGRP